MDFWISKWISGFQSGFLDFKVDFSRDFWISSEFLDFKADFWISKWISRGISGFKANFWIKADFWISFEPLLLKIQLKYTHDSSTAFLSACMLTEYKVTGTSPLHSAQAACSLIVIHKYTHTVIHKYSACSLLIPNVVSSPDSTLLAGRCVWAGHEHT